LLEQFHNVLEASGQDVFWQHFVGTLSYPSAP